MVIAGIYVVLATGILIRERADVVRLLRQARRTISGDHTALPVEGATAEG
jgi:hypothetical protein